MKNLLVFAVSVACFVCALSLEDIEVEEATKICKETYNVSEDAVFNEENPTEEDYCVEGCVTNRLKLYEDIEAAVQKFDDDLSEEKQKELADCFEKIEAAEDCELGAQMMQCEEDVLG